jgi:hypothetical protein
VSANWRTTRSKSASCLDARGAETTVVVSAPKATSSEESILLMYAFLSENESVVIKYIH